MAATSRKHATTLTRLGVTFVCTTACVGAEPVDESASEVEAEFTYTQHIAPLLAARCSACHGEGGIGGFALDDYEAAQTWANLAAQVIEDRQMPPFPPTQDGCSPIDDPRAMTTTERDMFLRWVADGQPLGDPDGPVEYEPPSRAPLLADPSHRFVLAADYVAPVEVFEEYRCFAIDPELAGPTRFRGLHVDTNTPERFHHARVWILPSERAGELDALDGSDGRPGWPCYYNPGIPGIDPIGGMLPSQPFALLPNQATIELGPGSRLVVGGYLHHDSFDPLDLSVVGWAGTQVDAGDPTIVVLSDEGFAIPANAASFETELETELVEPGAVWSVDVHMHQWGRSAQVEVVRSDGSRSCLLDVPSWDEEWQGSYSLTAPVPVEPGDRIVATCGWSNGAEDQPLVAGVQIPPGELTWGLDETHEMCEIRLLMTAI